MASFICDSERSETESDKHQDDNQINRVTTVLGDNSMTINITAPDEHAKIYLNCPYSCQEKYLKRKNLQLHLNRVHSKRDFNIDIKYFCHYSNCNYGIELEQKFFSGRKYLNQHFNKIHKSKLFVCDFCKLSFAVNSDYTRHLKSCNLKFTCDICQTDYKTHDRLLVHLMRRHPDLHKSYKAQRAEKRKAKVVTETKKIKSDYKFDYICDSPKRSFATQTLEENLKNDVHFSTWHPRNEFEIKKDEISTQTVFEDLLSLKSQSEDDSLFESVSLSDIQTQTFPTEFGLSRSNKETLTSETQSPDLSIKETQTCFCHYDSPIPSSRLLDSDESKAGYKILYV
ncbi:hypothetical protein K1T71_015037 [Dendrolimus kikuchii]|nr:hypothetical protein K1T71_015037 [Dendrolimus kikuchii]